jgi:hypothetical protein
VRSVVRVSSGPWVGFNGVQALVLGDETLFRIQASRWALRRDTVLDRYPLSHVTNSRWIRSSRGDAGRIEFRIDGKRKSFTSDRPEAPELAKMLPH